MPRLAAQQIRLYNQDMKTLYFRLFLSTTIFLTSTSLWAAFGTSSEDAKELSISGGIASPSGTQAVTENPAGLIYNQRLKIEGSFSSDQDDFDPFGLAGRLYAGTGSVGGSIGVQTFNTGSNGRSNTTYLDFGLAAEIQALNVALGFETSFLLNSGATNSGRWASNLGFIYNPKGQYQVGFELFDIVGGIDGFGGGAAFQLNPNAALAIDASVDEKFNGLVAKPGLMIHVSQLQMTAGYGIDMDNSASSWLRTGVMVGLGFNLSSNIALNAYYQNQAAKYYLGLLFKL